MNRYNETKKRYNRSFFIIVLLIGILALTIAKLLFFFLSSPKQDYLAVVARESRQSARLAEASEKDLDAKDKEEKTIDIATSQKSTFPLDGENKKAGESLRDSEKAYWLPLEELYSFFEEGRNSQESSEPLSSVRVFLDEQLVAGYRRNAEGEEELVRVFPCSSGYFADHTPLGLFPAGHKWEVSWLFDNSQAQYAIQITGDILFHSLPSYDGSVYSGLKITDINSMSHAASHGCVRLFCGDAKWLYERCPVGTPIEILQNRGEKFQDLPEKMYYFRLKNNAPTWDPTDPHPDNPYHDFALLQKWVKDEPWQEKFVLIPPTWPENRPTIQYPEIIDEGNNTEQSGFPEDTSSLHDKQEDEVKPTSPPPLSSEDNMFDLEAEGPTSPPPLKESE